MPETPLLSEIKGTPEIGKFYRVRCVEVLPDSTVLPYGHKPFWLATMGPKHEDRQLLDMTNQKLWGWERTPDGHMEQVDITGWEHFHVDWRFVPEDLFQRFLSYRRGTLESKAAHLAGVVVWVNPKRPAKTAVLLRRCAREMPDHLSTYQFKDRGFVPRGLILNCEKLCAGKRINVENPVCPHRGIYLGGLPRDEDNCVVCPGHGLRWSMTTGELVPWPPGPAIAPEVPEILRDDI